MKTAAFLPAKGSSQRVPNKNTMLLDGEPLFLRSLKKLTASSSVDEVWLDTESRDIANLASDLKCKILRRDTNLASNRTDGQMLFLNEVAHTDADNFSIRKDDLIFGDSDGILIIPKQHEPVILKEALCRKEHEAGILPAIAQGIRTYELVKSFGLF